jgi:hypothetical protein
MQKPSEMDRTGHLTDTVAKKHLVKRRQLLTHHRPDCQQRLDNHRKSGKTRYQFADPCFVVPRAHSSDIQAEVAQCAAHVALDVEQFALEQLATGQQHALFLSHQRLDMHRFEQAHAHHLSNSAGVIAVTFVNLLGLKQRLHVTGLDAYHRQLRLGQPVHQPLRQWARLNPNAHILVTDCAQQCGYVIRLGWNFALTNYFADFINNAHRCLLNRDIQTYKIRHIAIPSLMLKARMTPITSP